MTNPAETIVRKLMQGPAINLKHANTRTCKECSVNCLLWNGDRVAIQ